jgi:hypothetical protein
MGPTAGVTERQGNFNYCLAPASISAISVDPLFVQFSDLYFLQDQLDGWVIVGLVISPYSCIHMFVVRDA